MNNLLTQNAPVSNLLEYIEAFANNPANGANCFVYGSGRKLQERLRGNIAPEDYPILHLERPNITTECNDGGNYIDYYYCSINVYVKFTVFDEPEINDASERLAEQVSMQVLQNLQKQLNHDASRGKLEFTTDGNTKDPVFDNFMPHHLGWQMNVKIGLNANSKLC